MLTEKNISDKYKYCEFCGRTLPKHYEGTLCPTCQEAQLFRNVRDYIRANTVNEYEVAEHFHIPLRQIKEWIREGRIEYHEVNTASTISGMHCQRCGAPVSFGTLSETDEHTGQIRCPCHFTGFTHALSRYPF